MLMQITSRQSSYCCLGICIQTVQLAIAWAKRADSWLTLLPQLLSCRSNSEVIHHLGKAMFMFMFVACQPEYQACSLKVQGAKRISGR